MRTVLSIFLFFSFVLTHAQEASEEKELEPRYRVAIATINSHVPEEESNQRAIIPAWGLEAERRLNEKWAIMLNFEVELVTYFVDYKDELSLKREYPLVAGLLVVRRLTEEIILSAGYGREFETNESFDLLIFNLSYEIRLPNEWDISPGVTYNDRLDAFDTFSFNIAFGKSF